MEKIELVSPLDGFRFAAFRQTPPDARRGGLIVIQEIFGVTDHIREQAALYAEEGFEVIAPSLFNRRAPGFEAAYASEDIKHAAELSQATPWAEVAADLSACVAALEPPVFAVGWCWGGAAAWLAACRLDGVAAASCYYGRRIPEFAGETPRCPVIAHFGKRDASIPTAVVEQIKAANPDIPVFVYDAGHGFNSDRRADYDPDCARLARLRTVQLFARAGSRGEF
jgi:carboxymethylenebutenolidase